MRLLIALPDAWTVAQIQAEMENRLWETSFVMDGRQLANTIQEFDVLLIHHCLCGVDGWQICETLAASPPANPPRILFITPIPWKRPQWADCTVEAGVSPLRLCDLISLLYQKPLPRLAAAQSAEVSQDVEQFLDEIAMNPRSKGRSYAAWLLERMVLSSFWEKRTLNDSYIACAEAFGTSAASVERCLRSAVETVFVRGSMKGIERFFGATVDPERGKPTNRAFLVQAMQQLRLLYSRTAARSPNSSEMHHNPAAPTSV